MPRCASLINNETDVAFFSQDREKYAARMRATANWVIEKASCS